MRIHGTIVSMLAASAGFAAHSEAFTTTTLAPHRSSRATSVRNAAVVARVPFAVALRSTTTDSEDAAPCDAPSDVEEEILETAAALNNAALTNVRGETVVLGDLLRKNTSNVVVFLRHMG